VLAITGFERFAVAADILAVGVFIVGLFVLRSALAVVDEVATASARVSRHANWRGELTAIAATTERGAARAEIEGLAEEFRYAASDSGGTPLDGEIDQAISAIALAAAGGQDAVITQRVGELKRLKARREVYLLGSRSKA
jgi:hypothetical protein